MTYADNGTSVRRNWTYLTTEQQKTFELDEAALIAGDKVRNAFNLRPAMSPLRERFLLQEQANRGDQ